MCLMMPPSPTLTPTPQLGKPPSTATLCRGKAHWQQANPRLSHTQRPIPGKVTRNSITRLVYLKTRPPRTAHHAPPSKCQVQGWPFRKNLPVDDFVRNWVVH